ncbi:MAG: PDDEXK nuclease domain-containing protein [Candidatus Cloacimonetes bacterium]|jgi:predicted nuclease of restriction endonuclease-like (RecB) superfamily|nr:PDDEXK nuclease domain-containing protein [Candidatus Cloacimonadota bacterium]
MNAESPANMDFSSLVNQIRELNLQSQTAAAKSVNLMLTLRNWQIGSYISEYELYGSDRAEYGDGIIISLAKELQKFKISRTDKRELYRYLKFYRIYPEIVESVSPLLQNVDNESDRDDKCPNNTKLLAAKIVDSASPLLYLPAGHIFTLLSFTHLKLLIEIENNDKRDFYQSQCVQGNWSVRELSRQIHALLYERSLLSTNKQKLSDIINSNCDTYNPLQAVRDPYIFEFLGLKAKEVLSESDLEDRLLDHLQDFLLELGHGFCFEARQKRILIGDTQFYVDLVFYHRVLKCNILIELKLAEFNHENIGQLNTYVSWYRVNEMRKGDNPPIGILLCTGKDSTLVKYALAGIDNALFVSKYLLELPSKEEIQTFLASALKQELL